MTIDFSTVLKNLEGAPVMFQAEDGARKEMTLRDAAEAALLGGDPSTNPSEADKLKRFQVAFKIANSTGHVVSLSVEDIALVKKAIGVWWPPLVVGRAFELLDPAPDEAVQG